MDICKVLDETLALRDYDLKVNNIKVEREIEATIPAVTAHPHQLEQVFLNIINNGVDAMLESGRAATLKVRVYVHETTVIAEFRIPVPVSRSRTAFRPLLHYEECTQRDWPWPQHLLWP